jgi:hypothetical protein
MKKVKFTIDKKVRKYNLYFLSTTLLISLLILGSCTKQLDVKNPMTPRLMLMLLTRLALPLMRKELSIGMDLIMAMPGWVIVTFPFHGVTTS